MFCKVVLIMKIGVTGMEFKKFEDANEFSAKAEPILAQREDVYSLFFGVLQAIKTGAYENPFMAAIEENGEVLALFQMTPPHPVNIILTDEDRMEEVLDLAIESLITLEVEVSSIISLKPWANRFAGKWETKTGRSSKVLMDQGLYRLDQVDETLKESSGTWRFANEEDCPLIGNWYTLFEKVAGLPVTSKEDVKSRVETFVKKREVFFWEDKGQIVSMMKKSRPTKHGITVSLVFTPQEERRKGYARTMVAACSKELLKDYKFCVLYTDMMNPTSNKIYKEIGYKKIADSVQLGFI